MMGIGLIGALTRRNAIIIFMAIELMLNAANIAILALARDSSTLDGQIFVFTIICIAAAEASVGLAIIVLLSRTFKTIKVNELKNLKN
jgi:NADH-quinone oxidoreductase subunit K